MSSKVLKIIVFVIFSIFVGLYIYSFFQDTNESSKKSDRLGYDNKQTNCIEVSYKIKLINELEYKKSFDSSKDRIIYDKTAHFFKDTIKLNFRNGGTLILTNNSSKEYTYIGKTLEEGFYIILEISNGKQFYVLYDENTGQKKQVEDIPLIPKPLTFFAVKENIPNTSKTKIVIYCYKEKSFETIPFVVISNYLFIPEQIIFDNEHILYIKDGISEKNKTKYYCIELIFYGY